MKLAQALTHLANGGKFIRDNYGWQIVRPADGSGNFHHHRILPQTAKALTSRGFTAELRF